MKTQTKEAIKQIVRETIKQEYLKEMRSEIYRFIQGVGKEIVIEELKKINPPQVLVDRIDKMFQQKFTPIIKNAVYLSALKVAGKVNKQLRQVISLKTSTIMEIQNEVRKIPVETEEESLQQLAQDFPEYYEQITKDNKKEITLKEREL